MKRNFDLSRFPSMLVDPSDPRVHNTEGMSDGTTEIEMLCPRCGHVTSNTFMAYSGFDPNPHMITGPHVISGDELSTPSRKEDHYSILVISKCHTCREYSLWFETNDSEKLLLPSGSATVQAPSQDMPDSVKMVYTEASEIFDQSPRASAALLRLATQLLVDQLIPGSKDLNKKIGELVLSGLNAKVQRALDSLRVIGNNAVHPGTIDLNDDHDTAASLFQLLNFIVEQTITWPNQIDSIFDSLPQGAKDAVKKRDNK